MSSLKKGTRYVSTIYKYHLLTNQKEIPFATCHDLRKFYDGNGRTARFLTSYQLTQVLHYTVALCLSITIKKTEKITTTFFLSLMTKTTAVT